MTLAEAERQGVAAQNEGIDRKEQAIQGVIDGAFKIATELTQAISNNATNKAYAKMQEEYAIYSASGEALKNADGSPADVEQVKANYDNWVENKLNEINPLIRGNVRKSWNSNRGTHMGNLAAKSIEYANAQRQQSANESYTRAMTASFEGQSVQEQVSMITAGGDYDLEGMLSFLPGDTWQEKLTNAGLDNDVGLKMIQYGTDLTRLGYSPYDVSNSLKNARNSFVMSSVEQTVRGDYLSELKTSGNEAAFWKSTQEFLAGDIPGMDRRLTVDEQVAYIKRAKELASVDKAALIEENNNNYASYTAAAVAYTNTGGIMDSEWIEDNLKEHNVYTSLLPSDTKQALNDIGYKNDAVIKHLDFVESLNGVSSISEQKEMIKSYTKTLTNKDLAVFESLDLFTLDNNKARVRTAKEYVNANINTGGLGKNSLSDDASQISKGIAYEATNKLTELHTAALNDFIDGNAWSVEKFDSEIEKLGLDMDDIDIASKVATERNQILSWSNSKEGSASADLQDTIDRVYNNLSVDITDGLVDGEYHKEFLTRLETAGIDINSESARNLYAKEYKDLHTQQATREQNEIKAEEEAKKAEQEAIEAYEIAIFNKDFESISAFRYSAQNPEFGAIQEGGLTVLSRNEMFKKYGADIRTETMQEGSSAEILKGIAEDYGVDASKLDLENLGIYDGVNAIAAEYASNVMDKGIETANYYFDMYGNKGMYGTGTDSFNEYQKKYEAIHNSHIPDANGFKKTPTDPYERQEYLKLVSGLKTKLVFGDLNKENARTVILFNKGKLTEDDYNNLLSIADGDLTSYLKEDLGIDVKSAVENSVAKLKLDGYNYSNDPYFNEQIKTKIADSITDPANRKAYEDKLKTPTDFQKEVDGYVAETTLSSLFNIDETKKLKGMYGKDDENKEFGSGLTEYIQTGVGNIYKGVYDKVNPIAMQNAIEYLKEPENPQLVMLLNNDISRKTKGSGQVSKDDQTLIAISAGLQANGFTIGYDPFNGDKDEVERQKGNIYSVLGNLDNTTFNRVMDTSCIILSKTDQAKSIEAVVGKEVSFDSAGNWYVGTTKVSYDRTSDGMKLMGTTKDGSYIDLKEVNPESINRKITDVSLGAFQAWEAEKRRYLQNNPKAKGSGYEKIKLSRGYPDNGWTAELAREAVESNEEIQSLIADIKKLFPQSSIEIEYGNAISPTLVIKEIK